MYPNKWYCLKQHGMEIFMIMIIYIDLEREKEEDPLMHYLSQWWLTCLLNFSRSPILIIRPLYFIQVPHRLIMPNFKTLEIWGTLSTTWGMSFHLISLPFTYNCVDRVSTIKRSSIVLKFGTGSYQTQQLNELNTWSTR